MLTVDEVFISEHDLNHAVDVHVAPVHGIQLAVTSGLFYYVMDRAAWLEDLNALVFLRFKELKVSGEIDVALRLNAPDAPKHNLIFIHLLVTTILEVPILLLLSGHHLPVVGVSCCALTVRTTFASLQPSVWLLVEHVALLVLLRELISWWDERSCSDYLGVLRVLLHQAIYYWRWGLCETAVSCSVVLGSQKLLLLGV